jgi:hypothetical protein
MDTQLETLKDIRQIMERSGRFISLSGLSGISAGCCALVGAAVAHQEFKFLSAGQILWPGEFSERLLFLGACTFLAALVSAFVFTYLRSRREGVPIWGNAARRLLLNTAIPMLAGGALVLRLLYLDLGGLVAPTCLLFYGVALVNGSKYTLGEVRYLGYTEIILGAINCALPGYGLYFWAFGFGVMHIVYGIWMWNKYEKPHRQLK